MQTPSEKSQEQRGQTYDRYDVFDGLVFSPTGGARKSQRQD
jgi:hypothetical protein